MRSKPPIPNFALGFAEPNFIYTFLNLVATGKPILMRDSYYWLNKRGGKTAESENTLSLLRFAGIIELEQGKLCATSAYIKAIETSNQEDALKQFILKSVPEAYMRHFLKNAEYSVTGTIFWRPEFISPFLIPL